MHKRRFTRTTQDHECENCGQLIRNAKTVYVEEYEHDGNDYYCGECVQHSNT